MQNRVFGCVAMLVTMMFLGCEKKESAPATMEQTGARVGAAMDDAGKNMQDAGQAAKDKSSEVASAAAEQAQELYDQAKQYINDKKWDVAETTLSKLEQMKASLPADWAAKITELRRELNQAKASAGG